MKDNIYRTPSEQIEDFKFDTKVAQVFPDMISRSVPGYQEIIDLSGILADYYTQENSNIYDLGCSLGASSLAICKYAQTQARLIAVDNSFDMLKGCKENLQQQKLPFTVLQSDLKEVEITHASVVVMNFVLQFIAPEKRNELLSKIFNGLNSNGALIIAEKIKFSNQHQQNHHESWHQHFKKANGYSELEVAQKRAALENILISDTEQQLTNRIKNAGFKVVEKWFQAFNFVAFIAIKD